MTKKKRQWPDLQQKLERPWCYYCERDFDDLKILISHQKARHFKCERCGRRLNTAGGLSVHMNQVHKETLTAVDNANPGRQSLDIEIFGMEGIPQEIIDAHNQEVTRRHFTEEQERARLTGNPIRNPHQSSSAQPASKRPKTESVSDMKKRLAEFKAKKAEGVTSSGNVTPLGVGQQSPAVAQVSSSFPSVAPPAFSPPQQQSFSPQPQTTQPFGQPPMSQPAFGYGPPGQQLQQPGAPFQPQYPGAPGATPGQFGGASPPAPYQFGQGPPPSQSPINGNGAVPPHSGGFAGPQGLPQRPPYGAPGTTPFAPGNQVPPTGQPTSNDMSSSAIAASVDELISDAKGAASSTPNGAPDKEKKSKKDKKTDVKLVYFSEDVSPEEKMAGLSRYAFVPDHTEERRLDVPWEGGVSEPVNTAA